MTEPTDFKNTEYKKIRFDARVPGWEKQPMDLVRAGWVREDDRETARFLVHRMAPDEPNIDLVFVLTFSRPKKA